MWKWFARALCFALLTGCGASRPAIETDAALGRVIVYRNGVAYFERRAVVEDGELELSVPLGRVDDVLKSLRVIDADTGESLSVSYRTRPTGGGAAAMTILVPGRGPRTVRLIYVTDSPAWKATYRVTFDDDGDGDGAELEAWAIIDNISGEDWKRVSVGVGSTAALSFRYDLHSVRVVERETLSDEAVASAAPPKGGSPYALASEEVPVVAALDPMSLRRVMSDVHLDARYKGGSAMFAGARDTRRGVHVDSVEALVRHVEAQPGRVRIEGFAHAHENDKQETGLARAEALRRRLVEHGVPEDKIEAVSFGRVDESRLVRITAVTDEAPEQAKPQSGMEGDPSRSALFLVREPLSIDRDHSALVSLFRERVSAKRVYYYDPVSERGSKELAFRAVLLENPTDHVLESGPITVYAGKQFLGEGLSEPIPPKSHAFVPYAMDRELVVDSEVRGRDEIHRLVRADRGVVTVEEHLVSSTIFSLTNRSDEEAVVFVRHAARDGWHLRPTKLPTERLRGSYLFRVDVPSGKSRTITIEESTPHVSTIDLRDHAGADAVALFVKTTSSAEGPFSVRVQAVVALHREAKDLEQRIEMLEAQTRDYRARVSELEEQLSGLRKVRAAAKLSRDLAEKMRDISQHLQEVTLETAELRQRLLETRIRVQDAIADLSLDEAAERTARAGS